MNDATRHPLPSSLIHDLRTPLNQIIGYSEMLIEQAQETQGNGFVADLAKIRAAGGQLLSLINDRFDPIRTPQTVAAPMVEAVAAPMVEAVAAPVVEAVAAPVVEAVAAPVVEAVAAPVVEAAPLEEDRATRAAFDEKPVVREASSDATQGLLLVVDDIEANRDVLSRRLKRQGYSTQSAENGRQALEMLRLESFDLVLLDIMMPEMDGYETLSRIKADERLQHLPVIMISALSEVDSVVRCIEMGAEDYLFKPFNPILLRARIGASLDKKRAHDRETQLFEQLQQNFKRLQELEKLRDDLTHMIIHDLRTPLSSVIMGMQTLDVVGELNADQREMMQIAVSGGETLLGMINDLLDVEKLESGSMQLDYATLIPGELVLFAEGQVASLAANKQLRLALHIAPDLPSLRGDENKLRRTLVNLIGNAIKFTPPDGTVIVGVRHDSEKATIEFSVSDTGEGIPMDAFGRIFEKFGQVESRRGGRVMSTGLGLTFCKLAVEAHGGHITVESTPGQGSTFSFSIPIAGGDSLPPSP
jgi:two-component system sensor histidine kinase/response regulator